VKDLESAVAFYGTQAFQTSIGNGGVPVSISADPNDPEVQAISAFLRVLNALENIRSSINVVQRGQQMSSSKDAVELAGLALAETVDAIQVLSDGALSKSVEPAVLSSRAHLMAARSLLNAAWGSQASSAALGNMLASATRSLRAARSALANPDTLPPSFRN
jgi:hypothetical protein